MTTRIAKTSRTSRPPIIQAICPACRATRRCTAAGTATIGRSRREVLQCLTPECGLMWVAARDHLTTIPSAA